MKPLLALIGACCFALAGCSTTSVPLEQSIAAPADRVLLHQAQIPGSGHLIVIRDSGFIGGGCFATVFIDGERAARLDTREKASFYITPGEHLLGAALEGSGLCAANPGKRERDLSIKSGQVRLYRVFTSQNGDLDVLPSSSD
ncbi:hypothetical protein HNP46_006743 [Pseudomonas nitritireducens]|uniref:3-isopropylmalate dehydratase n=1 Tax=Pseudomonas nitroreducens TaxID=46680 RepID=A0A7W7KRW7_PSENT|nr:hypothetical protein [Pseudomonas nitritireducens]MBB4867824.1 hypothetical protein [Pseudomonas nitritireducens]